MSGLPATSSSSSSGDEDVEVLYEVLGGPLEGKGKGKNGKGKGFVVNILGPVGDLVAGKGKVWKIVPAE